MGEDYLPSKVSECQEGPSGNAAVAKKRNKRNVPVSCLDKRKYKGFATTNINGKRSYTL